MVGSKLTLATLVCLCIATAYAQEQPFCEGPFCPDCLDIVFVVDNSASVGSVHFSRYRRYMRDISKTPFTIGNGDSDYQVAVVTFSDQAITHWNWAGVETQSRSNYRSAINSLQHAHGRTNLGAGLLNARRDIINGPGNRLSCPDYCIIITNGGNNVAPEVFEAELGPFKTACDKVIAIGVVSLTVAPDNTLAHLESLVVDSSHAIALDSFNDFRTVTAIEKTGELICSETTCPACLDVTFYVDGSSSVDVETFEAFRTVVADFVSNTDGFNIGPGDNEYKVSAIVDSGHGTVEGWLLTNPKASDPIDALIDINRWVSSNKPPIIATILQYLATVIDTTARPQCSKYCVVLTATEFGVDNLEVAGAQRAFRQTCDRVIAIGLESSDVTLEFLTSFTNDDRFAILLPNPQALLETGLNQLLELTCSRLPTCPECADIALVLDSSSSIGDFRWRTRMLRFARRFATTEKWNIGTALDSYQVAPVVFSTSAFVGWKWGDVETFNDTTLEAAIRILPYTPGFTNTGFALQLARTAILGDTINNRGSCEDVCIIVTDSGTNDFNKPLFEQEIGPFVQSCGKVIAIATSDQGMEVVDLITPPDLRLQVTWPELPGTFQTVAKMICDTCPKTLG